ncbi:hypothetical protein VC83_01303 [Pseudogymnoascus destructans]|uniref:Uncharacterized protein n=1 Tax=Pseudogymnoascus destructans TaxID=655981 RepID=A0A177ALW3_9PEZI|nr:uncharacterized protein VC83_01303 [Pseudogymnoascus destructans]OAF62311.1 hypothetical protein VC83_01303 [Pseudogymnoascus destructans]
MCTVKTGRTRASEPPSTQERVNVRWLETKASHGVLYCISNGGPRGSRLSNPSCRTHKPIIQRTGYKGTTRARKKGYGSAHCRQGGLLPPVEQEKGKKRAQPRGHTRADYGGVKASVSGSDSGQRKESLGDF